VPIDISARSSLDVDARVSGRVVRIEGFLRDDLGRAIPSQPLRVAVSGPDTYERLAETGANGEISINLLLSDGDWTFVLTWPGDPAREGVSIEARASARQAVGAIALEAPETASPDAAWDTLIEVSADGHPVSGALVLVSGDCSWARVTKTDADGVARVPSWSRRPALTGEQVAIDAVAPDTFAAGCTFAASIADGAVHSAATGRTQTRIVDEGHLELVAGTAVERLLRPPQWPVSGSLRDRHGPVAGVGVSLLLDGTEVAGVQTDGSGAFGLDWTAAGVPPGVHRLRARFETAEGSAAIESASVDVVVQRDPAAIVTLVALPLAVVCALALLAGLGAVPRFRRRRSSAGGANEVGVKVVAGTPGVVLVDAISRRSIAGNVVIHWADGEVERIELDAGEQVRPAESGRAVRLEATAPGYLEADLRLDAALDRRFEVALMPFRAAVRAVLEEVATARAGLRRGWWGRRPPLDVGLEVARRVALLRRDDIDAVTFESRLAALVDRALAQDHGASAAAVEALAMLVERANFGVRPATADDLALARKLADVAAGAP
jgi:hypothetical protein